MSAPCYFRFPHTPHLIWLGNGIPRDDKLLDPEAAYSLLRGPVVVEEKLDGANLGLSVTPNGGIRVQNRGQYLVFPYRGQYSRLDRWLAPRVESLTEVLEKSLILFGEWCAAKHSLGYSKLPDWFVIFDVFDRTEDRFWSTTRRDILAAELGLSVVPKLFAGRASKEQLVKIVNSHDSSFMPGPLEGIVLRKENEMWLEQRAKIVRPGFTQAIDTHWSRRALEWNSIVGDDHIRRQGSKA